MPERSSVYVKRIIFATVDKSPHCVQVHYIRNELEKMMDLKNVTIENYVVVDNELVEIDNDIISMSKALAKIKPAFGPLNWNGCLIQEHRI